MERVFRISDEEADAWLVQLLNHIKKQHPHLAVRWWEEVKEKTETSHEERN